MLQCPIVPVSEQRGGSPQQMWRRSGGCKQHQVRRPPHHIRQCYETLTHARGVNHDVSFVLNGIFDGVRDFARLTAHVARVGSNARRSSTGRRGRSEPQANTFRPPPPLARVPRPSTSPVAWAWYAACPASGVRVGVGCTRVHAMQQQRQRQAYLRKVPSPKMGSCVPFLKGTIVSFPASL